MNVYAVISLFSLHIFSHFRRLHEGLQKFSDVVLRDGGWGGEWNGGWPYNIQSAWCGTENCVACDFTSSFLLPTLTINQWRSLIAFIVLSTTFMNPGLVGCGSWNLCHLLVQEIHHLYAKQAEAINLQRLWRILFSLLCLTPLLFLPIALVFFYVCLTNLIKFIIYTVLFINFPAKSFFSSWVERLRHLTELVCMCALW